MVAREPYSVRSTLVAPIPFPSPVRDAATSRSSRQLRTAEAGPGLIGLAVRRSAYTAAVPKTTHGANPLFSTTRIHTIVLPLIASIACATRPATVRTSPILQCPNSVVATVRNPMNVSYDVFYYEGGRRTMIGE